MPQWKKNKDSKFDIDLRVGEEYEDSLAKILSLEKVEVKTEIDKWKETGNIAIEIRCRGKLSGLSVTQASYWAHILSYRGYIKSVILLPVDELKRITKEMLASNNARITMGGDDNESELILVPLKKIWKVL
jgi:hypothetical protein